VLELRDIDQPVPTGNEVLVQVHAAGLHRGDWHVMTGLPYMIRREYAYTRQDVTDGTRPWQVIVDTGGRRTLSQLRSSGIAVLPSCRCGWSIPTCSSDVSNIWMLRVS
jgi:hypothetical protein